MSGLNNLLWIHLGDCASLENVYKASMVSMMAGSDFIKTSTGKEGVNATLPVAIVMVRCIREYYEVNHTNAIHCNIQLIFSQLVAIL